MNLSATYFDTLVRILGKQNKQFRQASVSEIAEKKRSPYHILISCLISLRTKDAVTTAASQRLFALAETPETMCKIPEKKIAKAIYPASYYNVKSKTIKRVSRLLLTEHYGKVPDTLETLLTLPGVGRKTANIVITVAYKKPGIAVDTHVHRISNRLGVVCTKNADATELALRVVLPKKHWIHYNDLLVVHGQNVCTPISPHCSICPLTQQCKQVDVVKTR